MDERIIVPSLIVMVVILVLLLIAINYDATIGRARENWKENRRRKRVHKALAAVKKATRDEEIANSLQLALEHADQPRRQLEILRGMCMKGEKAYLAFMKLLKSDDFELQRVGIKGLLIYYQPASILPLMESIPLDHQGDVLSALVELAKIAPISGPTSFIHIFTTIARSKQKDKTFFLIQMVRYASQNDATIPDPVFNDLIGKARSTARKMMDSQNQAVRQEGGIFEEEILLGLNERLNSRRKKQETFEQAQRERERQAYEQAQRERERQAYEKAQRDREQQAYEQAQREKERANAGQRQGSSSSQAGGSYQTGNPRSKTADRPAKGNTYYQTLQIDPLAEQEVIDAAYRRLVKKYHPDVYKGADANERLTLINEAYSVLRDPAKRREYDRKAP